MIIGWRKGNTQIAGERPGVGGWQRLPSLEFARRLLDKSCRVRVHCKYLFQAVRIALNQRDRQGQLDVDLRVQGRSTTPTSGNEVPAINSFDEIDRKAGSRPFTNQAYR